MQFLFPLISIGLYICIQISVADKSCVPRKYNYSSIVCVCNATYCDDIEKITKLPENNFLSYTSSADGLRFWRQDGRIRNLTDYHENTSSFFTFFSSIFNPNNDIVIKIFSNKQYQTIIGFGGAFTDSSGINTATMSEKIQDDIMRAYFGDNGIEFNLCRVPIGGTDFSTHQYAYNMEPEDDINLSNFTLSEEDFIYKIPYIKKAIKAASQEVYLMATVWSPPNWMKTNNNSFGPSRLYAKYFQTYADYHVKFLEEYDKNGIKFWGMTTGNEPTTGVLNLVALNSLGWLPDVEIQWIMDNLGPTIKNSPYKDIKIITVDDYKMELSWWHDMLRDNRKVFDYISGVGTHWYLDKYLPSGLDENTIEQFPELFILGTEACVGFEPWYKERVQLGAWERCDSYMQSFFKDFDNWYSGWIDWNFVLSKTGGPNYLHNFVDAPIIVFPKNEEYVKQPIFYLLGHFSKFIPRDSIKIKSTMSTGSGDVRQLAFLRPDGGIVVVIYNTAVSDKKVTIKDDKKGFFDVNVPKKSIVSVVYW